jgi:hypothetical protein
MAIPTIVESLYRAFPKTGNQGADVDALSILLNMPVPADYREWITFMDNRSAGAGYLVGLTGNGDSVHRVYEEFPHWISNRWLPVADDAFGNKYVMLLGHSRGRKPVALVYALIDPDKLCCAVSSDLFKFLESFFRDGLETTGLSWWNRGKSEVLSKDPELEFISNVPLPWDCGAAE